MNGQQLVTRTGPARMVSSGFTALDVILGEPARVAAGGTAANVAAACAALGWSATAAGVVGDDAAGRYVREDLTAAGVDVETLHLDARWTTPVVLQEPAEGDHVWRFVCPRCGTRFARHRPAPVSLALALTTSTPAPDVFFFDRPSIFTLALAAAWRQAGTAIVFEPSRLGRPHLFDQAARLAHLVKYSALRGAAFEQRIARGPALIRTSGAEGAEYRPAMRARWKHLPAPENVNHVDTAGAGDWTTAGVLTSLFSGFRTAHDVKQSLAHSDDLGTALRNGQIWGGRACGWQGARPAALAPDKAAADSTVAIDDLYCGRL